MGLAAFNRMRKRQVEAMKPENILAKQQVEEPKKVEIVEEVVEQQVEEPTPRRRTRRTN